MAICGSFVKCYGPGNFVRLAVAVSAAQMQTAPGGGRNA